LEGGGEEARKKQEKKGVKGKNRNKEKRMGKSVV
jgi:hypothetical protein